MRRAHAMSRRLRSRRRTPAGTRVDGEDMVAVLVLAEIVGGEGAVASRAPRRRRPPARSGTKASRIAGAAPDRGQGGGRIVAGRDRPPGPCRHSRSGGSSGRRRGRSRRRRRVELGRESDRARRAPPAGRARRRSSFRQAVLRHRERARAGMERACARRGSAAVAAGTFSNSKVTTSTAPAKPASAASSS